MTDSRNLDGDREVPGQIGWLDDKATGPSTESETPPDEVPSVDGEVPEGATTPTADPWSIPKPASPQPGRGLLIMTGLALLAVVFIIGLIFLGDRSSGADNSGATSSLSPDTYGLDLTTLCTGGATELIITGPDGVDQHVKCP